MKFQEIEIKKIKILSNSRKLFDENADSELAQSIKEQGIIEPLILRKKGDDHLLVCGERRLKAAKSIGLEKIPVVIRELNDQEAIEIQLIENLQRKDLNVVDEANVFLAFVRKMKCTIEDLAQKVGKSPNYVSMRIKVASFSEAIKKILREEVILPGHAIVLSRIENEQDRDHLLKKIVREKLSVKSSENLLENFGYSLRQVSFNQKDCAGCAFSGKKQEDLFDKSTKLKSKCLNSTCFLKKQQDYIQEKIKELEAAGNQVISLEKLNKKTDSNKWDYIKLDDVYYSKKLKNQYKEKCVECKKRFYAIETESYGDDKGIQRLLHVCTDKNCYRRLTTTGQPKNEKEIVKEKKIKAERKTDNLLTDVSRRFWVENLIKSNSQQERNAMIINILLGDLSYTKREGVPHIKQEKYYGASWDVRDLYKLEVKQQQEIIAFVISRNVERLSDSDLRFLCAQVGVKISQRYVIDQDYLKRKTKNQLITLAKEIGLDKFIKSNGGEITDSIKKTDLVEMFFKKGFDLKSKIPAEIKKLDVIKK